MTSEARAKLRAAAHRLLDVLAGWPEHREALYEVLELLIRLGNEDEDP